MDRPTKEQISKMPIFPGVSLKNISVVTNEREADKAAAALAKHACLGFDTESKPCFTKGETNTGPHLIQISSKSKTYLFPTKFPETIEAINRILGDPNIKKAGFGLTNDRKILNAKFGIKLENTEELSSKIKRFAGTKDNVGARAAVAMFFKQRLSKSAQTSNWANFPLQNHQLKYAADDAYAALCIELEIEKLIAINRSDEKSPHPKR